jgi:hypothetical protein
MSDDFSEYPKRAGIGSLGQDDSEPAARPSGSAEPLRILAIWAEVTSSRQRDMVWEWSAAGVGMCMLYGLIAVLPKGYLDVLDLSALLVIAFATAFAVIFSERSAQALRNLSKSLDESVTLTLKVKLGDDFGQASY